MENLTKKDFTSDQEIRWCPGCGDYAILNSMQKALPNLGRKKEAIDGLTERNVLFLVRVKKPVRKSLSNKLIKYDSYQTRRYD